MSRALRSWTVVVGASAAAVAMSVGGAVIGSHVGGARQSGSQDFAAGVVAELSPLVRGLRSGPPPDLSDSTSPTQGRAAQAPQGTGTNLEGPWVYATVAAAADQTDGGQLRALWEGELAAGAMASNVESNGSTPSGFTITIGDGSATVDSTFGFVLTNGLTIPGTAAPASDSALVSEVRAAADSLGVKVLTADVLHPAGPAVAVTVSVPDASEAATWRDRLLKAFQVAPNLDGLFLELDGPDGVPLERAAIATRVGHSLSWSASDAVQESAGGITG